jgi:hypothetical protein
MNWSKRAWTKFILFPSSVASVGLKRRKEVDGLFIRRCVSVGSHIHSRECVLHVTENKVTGLSLQSLPLWLHPIPQRWPFRGGLFGGSEVTLAVGGVQVVLRR